MHEETTINSTEKEKTREALSRFPAPSSIEMLTDAPVATMFDNASAIMTIGMMRLTAASASPPIKRPTKKPSAIE